MKSSVLLLLLLLCSCSPVEVVRYVDRPLVMPVYPADHYIKIYPARDFGCLKPEIAYDINRRLRADRDLIERYEVLIDRK